MTLPKVLRQTGNVYMAIENDLEILPVLNKVDLPTQIVIKFEQKLKML